MFYGLLDLTPALAYPGHMSTAPTSPTPEPPRYNPSRTYRTAHAVHKAVKAWRKQRDKAGRPPTLTGLLRALGITQQTLMRYVAKAEQDATDAAAWAIRDAFLEVVEAYEANLHRPSQCIGSIFALKVIAAWTEPTAAERDGQVVVQVVSYGDAKVQVAKSTGMRRLDSSLRQALGQSDHGDN